MESFRLLKEYVSEVNPKTMADLNKMHDVLYYLEEKIEEKNSNLLEAEKKYLEKITLLRKKREELVKLQRSNSTRSIEQKEADLDIGQNLANGLLVFQEKNGKEQKIFECDKLVVIDNTTGKNYLIIYVIYDETPSAYRISIDSNGKINKIYHHNQNKEVLLTDEVNQLIGKMNTITRNNDQVLKCKIISLLIEYADKDEKSNEKQYLNQDQNSNEAFVGLEGINQKLSEDMESKIKKFKGSDDINESKKAFTPRYRIPRTSDQ